jgi:hypothetical protein
MKRINWFAVLLALLGVWVGFRAGSSPSLAMAIQAAVAIVVGGNLLLMLWLWRRARPDSGEAAVLPGMLLLSVSMLVGLVPRLWPASEGLQIGASVVSVVLVVISVAWMRRRTSAKIADGSQAN